MAPRSHRVIGSLHIMDTNEILFEYRKDDKIHSKYISLNDAKAAFNLGLDGDSGWLPPGIIRHGLNPGGPWYVLVTPPQKVTIELNSREFLTIPIPHLVMLGWNKRYWMWALAEPFRSHARVYNAPFSNVYDDGSICWGGGRPGKVNANVMLKAWSTFFGTIFNTHEDDHKCVSFPETVLDFLRTLDGKDEFPIDELVPVNWPRDIDELIKQRLTKS